jgi:calcium/calmodulin-dependent protein kinase I
MKQGFRAKRRTLLILCIQVAVKCIRKKLVKEKPSVVYDEMTVLKDLDNPHIVKIFDWFE